MVRKQRGYTNQELFTELYNPEEKYWNKIINTLLKWNSWNNYRYKKIIPFNFYNRFHCMVIRFIDKVVQIGPKRDKPRTFSDQISVHFGSPSQNILKSDLKMSQICPFRANLTHFESKYRSSIPLVLCVREIRSTYLLSPCVSQILHLCL